MCCIRVAVQDGDVVGDAAEVEDTARGTRRQKDLEASSVGRRLTVSLKNQVNAGRVAEADLREIECQRLRAMSQRAVDDLSDIPRGRDIHLTGDRDDTRAPILAKLDVQQRPRDDVLLDLPC